MFQEVKYSLQQYILTLHYTYLFKGRKLYNGNVQPPLDEWQRDSRSPSG